MKNMKKVLITILVFPVAIVTSLLLVFAIGNATGLLFGFNSDDCSTYYSKKQTNLEHYFLPVLKYACQENGGIFQPALSNSVKWLRSEHKVNQPNLLNRSDLKK